VVRGARTCPSEVGASRAAVVGAFYCDVVEATPKNIFRYIRGCCRLCRSAKVTVDVIESPIELRVSLTALRVIAGVVSLSAGHF